MQEVNQAAIDRSGGPVDPPLGCTLLLLLECHSMLYFSGHTHKAQAKCQSDVTSRMHCQRVRLPLCLSSGVQCETLLPYCLQTLHQA